MLRYVIFLFIAAVWIWWELPNWTKKYKSRKVEKQDRVTDIS